MRGTSNFFWWRELNETKDLTYFVSIVILVHSKFKGGGRSGVIELSNLNLPKSQTPRKLTWLAGKSIMNEDVFPIEHGDFPASHVSFQGSRCFFLLGILVVQFGKKTSRRKEAEPKDVSIILVVMIASWCVFSFRILYIMTTVPYGSKYLLRRYFTTQIVP